MLAILKKKKKKRLSDKSSSVCICACHLCVCTDLVLSSAKPLQLLCMKLTVAEGSLT